MLPTPASSAVRSSSENPNLTKAVLDLRAFTVDLAAASDFGSRKLCDLPLTAMVLVSCTVKLTASMNGFTVDELDTVDIAVGSAATASSTLAGATDKDVAGILTGVPRAGALDTGKFRGTATGTQVIQKLAAGAKALYLNAASAVATGTGTLTLAGRIELQYIEQNFIS